MRNAVVAIVVVGVLVGATVYGIASHHTTAAGHVLQQQIRSQLPAELETAVGADASWIAVRRVSCQSFDEDVDSGGDSYACDVTYTLRGVPYALEIDGSCSGDDCTYTPPTGAGRRS